MIKYFLVLFIHCLSYYTLFANSENNQVTHKNDSILEYLEKHIQIDSELGLYLSDSLATLYKDEGKICLQLRAELLKSRFLYSLGQFDNSINSDLQVINGFTSSCDSSLYLRAYHYLSNNYISMEEFVAADSICQVGLDLFNKKWGFAKTKINLLINRGISNAYLGNIKESFNFFWKALYLAEKNELSLLMELSYNSLGTLYAMLGDNDSAIIYTRKAIPEALINENYSLLSGLYNNLAGLIDNKELSLSYMDTAIFYSVLINDYSSLISYYGNKALALKRLNRFEDAYNALYNQSKWKDSLFAKEKVQAFAQFQEKFEAEKKARQIQELEVENLSLEINQVKQNREKNILFFIGLFILLTSVALYTRLNFIRKSKKKLQIEKDRSEELLLNILPEEVAQELKAKGRSRSKTF
jgi:adenylate cyclase